MNECSDNCWPPLSASWVWGLSTLLPQLILTVFLAGNTSIMPSLQISEILIWLCEAVELPLVENHGTWHFSISRPWSCSFASKVLYWGWDKNKGKWGSQQDLFSFISRDECSEKLVGNFVKYKIIVSYLIGLSDRNKILKIIRTDVILGRQWIGKERLRKDLASMCSFQSVLGGWDPQETSGW